MLNRCKHSEYRPKEKNTHKHTLKNNNNKQKTVLKRGIRLGFHEARGKNTAVQEKLWQASKALFFF